MNIRQFIASWCVGVAVVTGVCVVPVAAQSKKPNIVVIICDDIGMWNNGAYHRGLMAGRTRTINCQQHCFLRDQGAS